MILSLETQKLKRSGYIPTFLFGSLIASAFPIVNMLVRSENFVNLPGDPFAILTNTNWQMIAMLNTLIVICGACMMYHAEYADNASQKMNVLPIKGSSIFFGKLAISAAALTAMIIIETVVMTWCACHWFPSFQFSGTEFLKSIGFQVIVTLPTVIVMLIIASTCKNMWVSLGIGVILVFTFSIIPQDNTILNLFPFSSPYQTLCTVSGNGKTGIFLSVCLIETVIFALTQIIFQKTRRCSE